MRSPVRLLTAACAPGAHLAARPCGVVHVYTGPLTPSRRYVPRQGATACRTRTRRLTVLDPSLTGAEFATGRRRACGSCSARLSLPSGRAEQVTRDDALTRYGHLTPFAVALLAFLAGSEVEVEWVQWLALLIVGYAACRDAAVVAPTGKVTGPLFAHIDQARKRLRITHDPYAKTRDRYEAQRADREFHEQVERDQAWSEWRADVEELGHLNAPARPTF